MSDSKPDPTDITRREFVETTAKAAAVIGAPMIVPRHVLGRGFRAPSDTLNVAHVGIGGMGMNNMAQILKAGENVVAIADVDFPYVERSLAGNLRPSANRTPEDEADGNRLLASYQKAAKYADFREMLAKSKDIDAVVIATPDHMHATVANAAMHEKKHVYVQKPLTYSVYEARLLARTAKETGVVTQMGNQGHSMEGTRRINELIAAGVIGKVHEVHIFTDRPQRYWAQGIPSPTPRPVPPRPPSTQPAPPPFKPMPFINPLPERAAAAPRWGVRTVEQAIQKAMADNPQTPPAGLDWQLFLGPVSWDVPYHPVYHPFSWRGWTDFGVSAIGDMGAHLIDQPFWALDLGYPTSVVSTSTPWGGPAGNPGSYPLAMVTEYQFAERSKNLPAVMVKWYDGGLSPMIAPEIPRPGGDGGGGIFVGEKGYITYETYGNNPRVYPEARQHDADAVKKTFARVTGSHEQNFADACKGKTTASSPFEYAAKLTETMLLGVVALRAGQGKKIEYDGVNMKITNIPEANQWLTREYRKGWEL